VSAIRRHRPEQQVHRAVVAHLNARGVPGVVFLHPANGGARSRIEGAIFKSLGVAAGAPDLLLWHQGRAYALELKAESGRVSESQADMLERLSNAGVATAVATGIDEAVATLESWQLLRGAVQ
jgi:hypothetical protein